MNDKIQYYNDLMKLTYGDAINKLLSLHGASTDDYYREQSYNRFFNQEIKSITKGKFTRTADGLYCHHIDEDKYLNLSDINYIRKNNYPFELQRKERLVFCDLFEHLILHALIAKETNGKFGFPGYITYISPMIEDWFIAQNQPLGKEWMMNCYHRAYLNPKEAQDVLDSVKLILPKRCIDKINEIDQEIEEFNRQRESFLKAKKEWENGREEREKKERIQLRIRQENEEKIKINKFYEKYPKFKELNIQINTPRKRLLSMLYELKYDKSFATKKDFETFKLSAFREDILQELYRTILLTSSNK
ncbi:hypothetical protein FC84_GL000279 [Lapidilactobacillus dextrinicus DSM 20335]|uniref:Uncharacterized protein n=1 Tax=Lapidilactobacillus dextrinicus DSM 20335 TaxID=1423738 RepID=A0A0R2BHN5_9LACO|nr:hypothetical protein [Lapidilactobacillus dextrinicus]KRM78801.1 hypothetical protein FC84_GL000279 [Lapidilactobacillus dextrinicus DSM 20335]